MDPNPNFFFGFGFFKKIRIISDSDPQQWLKPTKKQGHGCVNITRHTTECLPCLPDHNICGFKMAGGSVLILPEIAHQNEFFVQENLLSWTRNRKRKYVRAAGNCNV
jgi:hypothetical protein